MSRSQITLSGKAGDNAGRASHSTDRRRGKRRPEVRRSVAEVAIGYMCDGTFDVCVQYEDL